MRSPRLGNSFGQQRYMETDRVIRLLFLTALVWLGATFIASAEVPMETGLNFSVSPAATWQQLVRTSVPVPRGFLSSNQVLVLKTGLRFEPVGLRVLSRHPVTHGEPPTARRVLVSFPYYFPDLKPMGFTLQATNPNPELPADFPVTLSAQATPFSSHGRMAQRWTCN